MEYVTEKPNYKTLQLVQTVDLVRFPPMAGLGQFVIDTLWPERTLEDSEMILSAIVDSYEIENEFNKKKELLN